MLLPMAYNRIADYGSREKAADVTRQEIANLERQNDPAGRVPKLRELLQVIEATSTGSV